MRILAGGCIRQDPQVLRAYLDCLKWQKLGKLTLDFAFIDDSDESDFNSPLILQGMRPVFYEKANPKPQDAQYEVTDATHHWTMPMFAWLGREKQRILDYARENRYDAVWLVDSDLLCSPDTLSSLWNTDKDIVSGVFWTKWTQDAPPLPQVWLRHPYELNGFGMEAHEFLGKLADRDVVRVGGLGACTLIRAAALEKVAYFPPIEGLPTHGMWQGEDRHFCVGATRNHVELYADAWPDIWHCYRPDQRANVDAMKDNLWCWTDIRDTPCVGESVSFTIEPLEEPQIAGYKEHVRGRLGAIKMLKPIEDAITEMRAGDERILQCQFPHWYPVEPYRGRTKLLRIRLLHVKPYASHPSLDTDAGTIINHFMEAA